MILSMQDDGVLYVYASIDDAVCDVEPLDAQETFQATYDENGQTYAIDWIRPNQVSRRYFGIGIAKNGEYRLVATGILDPNALLRCIQSANNIEPADQKPFVLELTGQLTNRLT